jgi:hypothetical protein
MQEETMDYILHQRPSYNSENHPDQSYLKICLNFCEPIDSMKTPKNGDRLP